MDTKEGVICLPKDNRSCSMSPLNWRTRKYSRSSMVLVDLCGNDLVNDMYLHQSLLRYNKGVLPNQFNLIHVLFSLLLFL